MAASENNKATPVETGNELDRRLEIAAKTGGQRGMRWAWRRSKKQKPIYSKMSPRRWLRTMGWRHLVAILAVLFSMYPVMYIVSSSLSGSNSLGAATFIPTNFDTDTYKEIFSNPPLTPFMTWLRNSWIVAGIATRVLRSMTRRTETDIDDEIVVYCSDEQCSFSSSPPCRTQFGQDELCSSGHISLPGAKRLQKRPAIFRWLS